MPAELVLPELLLPELLPAGLVLPELPLVELLAVGLPSEPAESEEPLLLSLLLSFVLLEAAAAALRLSVR